ncbi:hypothetical protein L208DRAFT_1071835, partial [Tricholoma matsutake]
KCAPSEASLIEDCISTKDIWAVLSACHKLQGPTLQVTMIQEAFAIRYSASTPFADMTTKLCDLNKRIWDMGAPMAESFLIILMLLTLVSPDLTNAHNSVVNGISSTLTSPYMSLSIMARLDLEQTVCAMDSSYPRLITSEAHIACPNSKMVEVCSNCMKPHHTAPFCIQPGGGMAGKTVAETQSA